MRKNSIQKSAEAFVVEVEYIESFLSRMKELVEEKWDLTWIYDLAVIRLYRSFEDLIFNTLILCLNRDSATLSERKGITFPRHLSVPVCGYIIMGDGYFDFRGRDGLIKTIGGFAPREHCFLEIVKDSSYKDAIERMVALRNFAAHDSNVSKKNALAAIPGSNLSSSGAWLKVNARFSDLSGPLKTMA